MKNKILAMFIFSVIGLLFGSDVVLAVDNLPEYLQGGGDATRTLSRFMNGALRFLTTFLWGIWALFAVLFAKDLMIGKDAEDIKSRAFKLGAAALVLLMITALPAMFAGFVN